MVTMIVLNFKIHVANTDCIPWKMNGMYIKANWSSITGFVHWIKCSETAFPSQTSTFVLNITEIHPDIIIVAWPGFIATLNHCHHETFIDTYRY